MDVAFAAASALEVTRRVRLSDQLVLRPVESLDTTRFSTPRGAMSKLNFLALGLSRVPTKTHPASIRVPSPGNRKRLDNIRCLLFPKGLPKSSLAQLVPAAMPTMEDGASDGGGARKTASPSDAGAAQSATTSDTSDTFAGTHVFVDTIPLALAAVAASYQRLIGASRLIEGDAVVRLVELIMEFAGHYSRDPSDPSAGSITENLPAATSVEEIQSFISSSRHVMGVSLLSKALRHARNGSRSAMETCLWICLTMPSRYGLFEIGHAKLNAPIVPTATQRALMQHKTLTPDILWEQQRTAVEYQGFKEHTSRSAHAEDTRRLNDYQVCGIRAHFVAFDDIRTSAGLDRLALKVAESMAIQGFPEDLKRVRRLIADEGASIQRARHLAHLLPPVNRV